jgi:hypothetical protein
LLPWFFLPTLHGHFHGEAMLAASKTEASLEILRQKKGFRRSLGIVRSFA